MSSLMNPPTTVFPTRSKIASGSYAGDDSADKAIAHGLGVIPDLVLIFLQNTVALWYMDKASGGAVLKLEGGATTLAAVVAAMTSTNFYVGDAVNFSNTANAIGSTYYWLAIANI